MIVALREESPERINEWAGVASRSTVAIMSPPGHHSRPWPVGLGQGHRIQSCAATASMLSSASALSSTAVVSETLSQAIETDPPATVTIFLTA